MATDTRRKLSKIHFWAIKKIKKHIERTVFILKNGLKGSSDFLGLVGREIDVFIGHRREGRYIFESDLNRAVVLVMEDLRNLITVTNNYTVSPSNRFVIANASSQEFTVTLYTPVGNAGKEVTITKNDSTSNFVTISATGFPSYKLYTQGDSITLYSNGVYWYNKEPFESQRLIQTQTISSPVATVDFTKGINGNFRDYLFLFKYVYSANDGYFVMRTSSNGGSSFDAWFFGAS